MNSTSFPLHTTANYPSGVIETTPESNVKRWKYLSANCKKETIQRIAFIALAAIALRLMITNGDLIYYNESLRHVVSIKILSMSSIFVGLIVLTIKLFQEGGFPLEDFFTRFDHAKTARHISLKIAESSLNNFNYSDDNLKNLHRYGFINYDIFVKIRAIFKKKEDLEKYLQNNSDIKALLEDPIRSESIPAFFSQGYQAKNQELKELEQEYLDFKNQHIIPYLPFPAE